MLVFGKHRDTLGGENGVDAQRLEEVGSRCAEEKAELGKSQ